VTDDGECLVGISKWESEAAFRGSGITLRPSEEIVEGETRPATAVVPSRGVRAGAGFQAYVKKVS
jgi:hypothetical protein